MKKRMIALAMLALMLAAGCAAHAKEEIRYAVEVDLTNQIVTVYDADGREAADIVRQMICSTGSGGADATPKGKYKMKQHFPEERGEWYYIKQYGVYVRYPTRIHGPYLFHSIPYAEMDEATIDAEARSGLGEPVSHGCIRLRTEDAEWIAKNCPDGTSVRIFEGEERDDALREKLLRRSYVAEEWPFYSAYLAADIPAGLTGALEAALRSE